MSQPQSKVCARCKHTIYPAKTPALAYFRSCCKECHKIWYETPMGEQKPVPVTPAHVKWVGPKATYERREV